MDIMDRLRGPRRTCLSEYKVLRLRRDLLFVYKTAFVYEQSCIS